MTEEPNAAALPASIDGLEFVMLSSSGSAVSDDPTRFRYQQDGDMLHGQYTGDTVKHGRLIGRRDGDALTICFAHSPIGGGEVIMGIAHSVMRRGDDGKLYLDEIFEKNGVKHESQCVQSAADAEWPAAAPMRSSEISLAGTSFVLEHSTASAVHPTEPTRFDFEHEAGIVWGHYYGDTVTGGYTVGRVMGEKLEEYFVHHHKAKDQTLLGDSATTVRRREDGRLELIEDFVLDGVPGISACIQIPR